MEAETRILLHSKDAQLHGFVRVVVLCKDTDVLVLLVHFKHHLPREILYMSGTKKDPKHVPVHEIKLNDQLQSVLPAFHALTGCDTVSQFAEHGKVTSWKAFRNRSQLKPKLLLLESVPKVCSKLLQCSCKRLQQESANVWQITSSVFHFVAVVQLLVVIQRMHWKILIQRMSCKRGK